MAPDRIDYYWKAAKGAKGGWVVGVLLGVGFLWFLVTSDSTLIQFMLGFVAILVFGYAVNQTRTRAMARRIQDAGDR